MSRAIRDWWWRWRIRRLWRQIMERGSHQDRLRFADGARRQAQNKKAGAP